MIPSTQHMRLKIKLQSSYTTPLSPNPPLGHHVPLAHLSNLHHDALLPPISPIAHHTPLAPTFLLAP